MIQTTLFNYFSCNDSIQSTIKKVYSFKQTNLIDYFKTIPKKKRLRKEPKKDSILNYFKPIKAAHKYERKVFDLVLVDIKHVFIYQGISCVKRNLYDKDLKYIAISYRWGKLNEQLVNTPDYTAHVTSFSLLDLSILCSRIKNEPDLKDIGYLWIDAISVDQYDHVKKNETILKMNQIYQNATYILAVPDLHYRYLWDNTANMEIMNLIWKHREIINEEILNIKYSSIDSKKDEIKTKNKTSATDSKQHQTNNNCYSIIQILTNKELIKENEELRVENNQLKMEMKKNQDRINNEDKKKIYQFLAYLIDDWSNRTWVISEYSIAKKKYNQHRTPFKYWLMTFGLEIDEQYFLSFRFDHNDDDILTYREVYNLKTFHQFIKTRFMQRSHLDIILHSNTYKNEDRFNAILPTWDKYKYKIKNNNTISNWKITDMTSVKLKLYEIMNDDLWDKARLLYASKNNNLIIFPTFASHHNNIGVNLIEIDDINNAHKKYEKILLKYAEKEKEKDQVKQLIKEFNMDSKPIWTKNLISIQLDHHCHYLSVKSNSYFIFQLDKYDKSDLLNQHPLLTKYNQYLTYHVYIPFFTFAIPNYNDVLPFKDDQVDKNTGIFIFGDMNHNKWFLIHATKKDFTSKHFCSNDYTFKIY